MIEILPFFPLLFRKPEEQNSTPIINIDLDNRSTIDIICNFDGEELVHIPNNTSGKLTTLVPNSKLIISTPNEEQLINVEISGENTNETHLEKPMFTTNVMESVTIIITDYVEGGGK